MAFTQAEIDKLKKAIAIGARKVRYESAGEVREVMYRSHDEMLSVLSMMEREVGGTSKPRSVLVTHKRGC